MRKSIRSFRQPSASQHWARRHSSRRHSARQAFTLLEVLVATAVTLLMMISLAQVFKIVGDSMKQGRAALQMNNTLRSVSFRLRHDLNNLTIQVTPPADSSAGAGYFEYFDGAMTDYTCALYDPGNAPDPKLPTNVVRSSRFGDLDDILMFTAKAGDSWFMGKVPQFILTGSNPSTPSDYNMVTISARHAEIVVFARPLDLNSDGLYDDLDGDSMPDGYQLHYRTLLIRPDLNDPAGVTTADGMLPFVYNNTNPWMVAFAQGSGLPAFACDMALAHQQCDLSLRRVANGNFASLGYDRVAANSLEDLMNPANRFAHVQMPIPQTSSTTMPVLALDVGLPILNVSATPAPMYTNTNLAFGVGAGFLHEAFVLGALASSTADDVRLGEDVLCGDVLAFDAKGFDPGVPILGTKGLDGVPAALTVSNFGADGSDDVALTPNDPGYARALATFSGNSGDAVIVGYGSYVDLMWGRKTLCSLPYFSMDLGNLPDRIPNINPPNPGELPLANYLVTELSGYRVPNPGWRAGGGPSLSNLPFSLSLYRSGKVVTFGASGVGADPAYLFQPTFDTWTTRYESDGLSQAELAPMTGVVQFGGLKTFYNSGASPQAPAGYVDSMRQTIDAGSDGIDNNGSAGADDPSELETLPPFPVKLRGVKVSIRVEDRATRQVRQMSVANEFVTQ